MRNYQNEVIQDQAIESYKEKLESMNYEELLNEFFEKFDCSPEDYFSNPLNYNNKEIWIDKLVENLEINIHDNPELVLSFETKMDNHIRKINELTKQINSI